MTDNMDEFEHEDLGPMEHPSGGEGNGGFKKNIAEAWRTQPLFKLMVIMVVVGVAIAGALGVFSGPPSSDASKLVRAPDLNEPPGGKASPYFIEQNKQANADRADQAMQQGSSAMPTPVGPNIDIGDLTNKKKEDPLAEFRAETERLKQEMNQERQQNAQQIQNMQQQQIQQKPQPPEDNTLAQAMQKQMQQLMESWTPRNMKVVEGAGAKEKEKEKAQETAGSTTQTGAMPASASQVSTSKTIVQAGSINYAQLLIEANSDIPGPILAQVLSGPLAGGRAIGQFKATNDFLVIEFSLINYKGKDYPVSILALDPNTTLGGMATDVDHRYLDRVLLPAAARFAEQFGSTLGQGSSQTTVTNGAVVVDQARRSTREAIFSGMGQAGQSIGQFLQQEASQIKPLVVVAAGTPMGLFFLTSVKENPEQNSTAAGGNPYAYPNQPGVGGYRGAGGIGGYSAVPGYANSAFGATSQTGYSTNPYSTNPYSTNPYGSTGYNPVGYNQAGYNPAAGGGYASGYNPGSAPGYQTNPGSGITIITPGQTGLGTSYYGR